ncbi:MAG: hypothetical protein JSV92_02330 [archaeon]|nr:MAG: hypothetical protein JSV92_02330 [archaeon]
MKGISPFIAAILLMAFVVAVGSIVSPWFISFTKSKSSDVEHKSEGQIDCIFSSLDFSSSDIDYSLTTSPDWVNITLDNTGSTELYDFEITITVSDEAKIYSPTDATQKTFSDSLESGGRTILVTNITEDISGTLQKVRVVAKNCPREAKKEVELS